MRRHVTSVDHVFDRNRYTVQTFIRSCSVKFTSMSQRTCGIHECPSLHQMLSFTNTLQTGGNKVFGFNLSSLNSVHGLSCG